MPTIITTDRFKSLQTDFFLRINFRFEDTDSWVLRINFRCKHGFSQVISDAVTERFCAFSEPWPERRSNEKMEKRKRRSETKGEEAEERESMSGCHQTRLAARRERTWLASSRSGARGAAIRDRSFHHDGGRWARTISERKCVSVCVSLCVSLCVSVCLTMCLCVYVCVYV